MYTTIELAKKSENEKSKMFWNYFGIRIYKMIAKGVNYTK